MVLQNCDGHLQSDQFGKMRAKKCLMFDAHPSTQKYEEKKFLTHFCCLHFKKVTSFKNPGHSNKFTLIFKSWFNARIKKVNMQCKFLKSCWFITIARLNYQPLFGIWACAPPPDREETRRERRKLSQQDSQFISFMSESIRKLSNFNFQWTKTLYQNNLNNITFFFCIL